MNSLAFSKLVARRLELIQKTLDFKGKEYSTTDDKLHNFNKAARMSNQSREKALKGMLLKHEVSISDIIDRTETYDFPSREVIDEKIGDIINYYILLEACLVERIKDTDEDK